MVVFSKKKTKAQEGGPLLGVLPANGKDPARDIVLSNKSRGHVAAIAGPGNFKSMSLVASSLLGNPNESVIVNDPSGELYSICEPHLTRLGYDCHVMTMFPQKVSRMIGRDVIDVGCDPFIGIEETPESELRSEIEKRMRWIVLADPSDQSKETFFKDDARDLGTFLSFRCLVAGVPLTMPNVRQFQMQGPDRLMELYELCEQQYPDAFGGVFSELAASFRGVQSKAGAQAMGGFGTAKQFFSPYSHGSEIGRHTSGSSFDPRVLKDPNKQTALFVINTLEHMKTYARVTAMQMGFLFDTIASDPQPGTVTAYLDECGAIPYADLPDNLLFYRKMGLRIVAIFQDLEAQTERQYGPSGTKAMLSGCQHQMLSGGCLEYGVLERFSKLAGTQSVVNPSLNDRSVLGGPLSDLSSNLSHTSVPLMRPETIQLLGPMRWLLLSGHSAPMVIDKLPYWDRPELLAVAGPSPYHRG